MRDTGVERGSGSTGMEMHLGLKTDIGRLLHFFRVTRVVSKDLSSISILVEEQIAGMLRNDIMLMCVL